MEINTNEDGHLDFSNVYSPIRLIAGKGEHLTIAMRDGAFEVAYGEHVLIFKKGAVGRLKPEEE